MADPREPFAQFEAERPAAWTVPGDLVGGPDDEWVEVVRLDALRDASPRMMADIAAIVRDYLTTETEVDRPSFHATAIMVAVALAGVMGEGDG